MPRQRRPKENIRRIVVDIDTSDPKQAALYANYIEWTRQGKAKHIICQILMNELGIGVEAPPIAPQSVNVPRIPQTANSAPGMGQKSPSVKVVREAPAVPGVEGDDYWDKIPGFLRQGRR